MGKKILVIGNGGREHCIAWALSRSEQIEAVYVAPGNGGTASLAKCSNVSLSPLDFQGLMDFAKEKNIDLTVVGPEAPLAAGIVDRFQAENLLIFGPNQAGARLEASKSWAKEMMEKAGIPTASAMIFTDVAKAKNYVLANPGPLVIKADGLAQGKGVTVALDTESALTALNELSQFGAAGETVVIEEMLLGEEASVLAFTDGKTILAMPPAQDHKRIGVGDTGPNTGGMGAYAPAPVITPQLMDRIYKEVLEPILAALTHQGVTYRGVLYAGLMISPAGEPKVIEFNCRFGDPETQVLLPLLKTPLEEVLIATAEGTLDQIQLEWKSECAACVVLAAGGYPGSYRQEDEIFGLEKVAETGATVFHSGTRQIEHQIVTQGGRIMAVSATATTLKDALKCCYEAISKIQFEGVYYRPDIGWRAGG
ncbi:MAG: phosphoribosylamine--glycine ligase [Anaerolineae bacterium]|nr:phosphoribosylamine--glycine ligase [Gloeobacterales cyanobacterium ES-bin-313]